MSFLRRFELPTMKELSQNVFMVIDEEYVLQEMIDDHESIEKDILDDMVSEYEIMRMNEDAVMADIVAHEPMGVGV